MKNKRLNQLVALALMSSALYAAEWTAKAERMTQSKVEVNQRETLVEVTSGEYLDNKGLGYRIEKLDLPEGFIGSIYKIVFDNLRSSDPSKARILLHGGPGESHVISTLSGSSKNPTNRTGISAVLAEDGTDTYIVEYMGCQQVDRDGNLIGAGERDLISPDKSGKKKMRYQRLGREMFHMMKHLGASHGHVNFEVFAHSFGGVPLLALKTYAWRLNHEEREIPFSISKIILAEAMVDLKLQFDARPFVKQDTPSNVDRRLEGAEEFAITPDIEELQEDFAAFNYSRNMYKLFKTVDIRVLLADLGSFNDAGYLTSSYRVPLITLAAANKKVKTIAFAKLGHGFGFASVPTKFLSGAQSDLASMLQFISEN